MRYRALTILLIVLLLLPQSTFAGRPPISASAGLADASLPLSITEQAPNPADPLFKLASKFEPSLLKKLIASPEDESVRAIAVMRQQVDLSLAAPPSLDRLSRHQAVLHTLHTTAERSQMRIRSLLADAQQRGSVESYTPLWIVNAIAVKGRREALREVAAHPDVSMVLDDHVHHLPAASASAPLAMSSTANDPTVQWNIDRIDADLVWEALEITGAGVVVATLDSGVDWQHPILQASYRGYTGKPLADHADHWYCATDEGYTYPGDGLGHGTHVMGTMIGPDGIGVAPGARWIAAKVFDNQGIGYDSWIHQGFQWILAPNGDPLLAPDIVNSSWGSSLGTSQEFLPDVQALRAAGILPIFSAGNDGPGQETVGAPASFRDALAVGATDADDLIARFSSRGPSAWGDIKPQISAPGVDIRSTLPGGGFGYKSGTSMAAPHIAGVVALMLEAHPALTPNQIESILLDTAIPLGAIHPNNDYGWGLVDAYAAVDHAGRFGRLSGQVTEAATGTPIVNAAVEATAHGTSTAAATETDARGTYTMSLAADAYDVTYQAFGYAPYTAYHAAITTGMTTTLDIALDRLATGELAGTIREAGTGTPLAATVSVDGTPLTATSDPGTGTYSLTLPRGTHQIRFEVERHRFATATVTISAGLVTSQDIFLERAPTILLIDGGAWYNDSQRRYYEEALHDARYLYDRHVIANTDIAPTDIPTAGTLLPYDVVIWSSPQDSPGYIGASGAITTYLEAGGKLLLSGQDIAFWDSGGSGMTWAPYLRDYLKVHLVEDDASSRVLHGQGILAGLTISISGAGGADNQRYPDVIRAAAEEDVDSVWTYVGDGSGGQTVGGCLPYRAAFLSFGFEGIDDAQARRQVLERSIEWLSAPPQTAGVTLLNQQGEQIQSEGGTIVHTVRLRNKSQVAADTFALLLAPGAWPTTLESPSSLTLGPCQSATLTITVQVPANVGWHVYDTATVTAQSTLSPSVTAIAYMVSKTPAPVLLVDGSRFYNVDDRYRTALDAVGAPYDRHRVKHTWPLAVPTTATLSMYPMVVWYTAYDWYEPLGVQETERLIAYLDRGGRLFFSSQDYLYYHRGEPLATDYLGVLEPFEDLGTTHIWGEPRHPVGWGVGPYTLTYTYTNWSDGLIPADEAEVALRGQHKAPAMITHRTDAWRTAFAAFPFDAFDAENGAVVMERTLGWLSWLGRSQWHADRRVVASGSQVTLTCTLVNDGWDDLTSVRFTATLPAELSLIGGSLSPELSYDPGHRSIHWQGALGQNSALTLSLRAQVADPLPSSTYITVPAQIGYDDHQLYFDRPFILRVDAPDLSTSVLSAHSAFAPPRAVVPYTLTVRNVGLQETVATVSATHPAHATFTGTLDSAGIGTGTLMSDTLLWTGPIGPGKEVQLRYALQLDGTAEYWLWHQAWISDEQREKWPVVAKSWVRYEKIYLPQIYK